MKRHGRKKKRGRAGETLRRLLVLGIVMCCLSIGLSMGVYLRVDRTVAEVLTNLKERHSGEPEGGEVPGSDNGPENTGEAQRDANGSGDDAGDSGNDAGSKDGDMAHGSDNGSWDKAASSSEASAPYLTSSGELGRPEDFDVSAEVEPEGTVYFYITDSALGPMIYYNQHDRRWGDYLYGGRDPMTKYGCGPTAVAMLISSFSSTTLTPPEAADWAAEQGLFAPGSGSYHALIPEALTAHGLSVESVKDRSIENVSSLLNNKTILVALMGRGALTQNGHFIIITQLLENQMVRIADPSSYENSTKEWQLSQLLSELKGSRDSGAPLWAVSLP